MSPERRERALDYVELPDYDEWREESPPRREASPVPAPPAPPDWEAEDEYEPVQLDFSRPPTTKQSEEDEEATSKWSRARDRPARVEDYESSDDEYVQDDPRATELRRAKMQRYRSRSGPGRYPIVDRLLEHPDIACQPRFNQLPLDMDDEMRGLDLGASRDELWRSFWRMCDRNWCFFCTYRRTNKVEQWSNDFREAVDMMRRPLFDHDEEYVVTQLQNMFFVVFQPLLPPRKPCKRTGKPKPLRYLWKSSIRRCMDHHQHRPTHDLLASRNVLKEANRVLSSLVFKRGVKRPADVQFDGARMKQYRDNADMMMRIDDKVAKHKAEYRS